MATQLKTYTLPAAISAGVLNPDKMHLEIAASGHVTGFDGFVACDECFSVMGTALANESALDALVYAHEAVSLAEYKAARCLQIDMKTGALIEAGFMFDGTLFSLSASAQMNWTSIMSMRQLFSFPLAVSTKAGGEYVLAEANLLAFIDAGRSTIYTSLSTGRALKVLVNAATTKAGVDAVVDSR